MALFVRTTGWDGGELDVTVGANSDTWAYDTQLGLPSASVVDVLDDVVAWYEDGARPWTATASWSAVRFADARFGARLSVSTSTTFAPSSELQTLLGWASSTTDVEVESAAGLAASMADNEGGLMLRHHYRSPRSDGGVSDAGSWIAEAGGIGPSRPVVNGYLSEAQLVALTVALGLAYPTPREAHIRQFHHEGQPWRLLQVGRVTRSPQSLTHYSVSLEVLGA